MASVRRTAGIHIDSGVATLARVDIHKGVPTVLAVHQVNGFSGTEALERALAVLDEGVAVRVTFATPGVAATPVDLTPATLDRAGFTAAARRAFVNLHASAAVAGVVPRPEDIAAGQIGTGLAVAAPGDVVTALYRVLHRRPEAEVTTCAAAYGPLDGLHLAIRRSSTELTWVRDHAPVLSQILSSGGSDDLSTKLGSSHAHTVAAMTGTTHDPAAVSIIGTWLRSIVDEVATTLNEWEILGHNPGRDILVHGKAATASALDDLLSSKNLSRQPHPLVALPHDAPLDAVDAYYAALTCHTHTPLAGFYHAEHPSTSGAAAAPTKRRGARAKTAAAPVASQEPTTAAPLVPPRIQAPVPVGTRGTHRPAGGSTKAPKKTRTRGVTQRRTTNAIAAVTAIAILGAAGVTAKSSYDRYQAAENLRTEQTRLDSDPTRADAARGSTLSALATRSELTTVLAAAAARHELQLDVTSTAAFDRNRPAVTATLDGDPANIDAALDELRSSLTVSDVAAGSLTVSQK